MKYSSCVVLLFLSSTLFAQAPRDAMKVANEYDKAILTQDAEVYERILSDDYTLVGWDGEAITKAEFVADAKQGETKFEIAKSANNRFRTFGDAVVWTGDWTEEGTSKGQHIEKKGRFTTVLGKRNGKWMVVADQVTEIKDTDTTATKEEFKEFCENLKGRWAAEITWVADWPGVGKKGEKATGYFDVKLDADGHALVGRHYAGSGAGIWTIVYDASEKKIGGIYVDKSGINHMTYYKKDGKWMEQGTGSLVDGRKTEGLSTITFEGNGNRMVLDGTGTIDGESHNERHDVYHRVRE